MTVVDTARLEIPSVSGVVFHIARVSGREALHEPWRVTLVCELRSEATPHQRADADPTEWLGEKASVAWQDADGDVRRLDGVIDEVAFGLEEVELVVVHPVAAHPDECDYRVFVDQHAVDIAKLVLSEHGMQIDVRVERVPAVRAQIMQVFESDLDFLARILADEGIAWFASEDGIVLTDHPNGFDTLSLRLPVRDEANMSEGEVVFHPRLTRRAVVGEVALRDYDFSRPQLDLNVRAGDGGAGLTHYEFPAGYTDPDEGRALAQARLQELSRYRATLTGETQARSLRAGGKFTVEEGPESLNGDWLVVEVTHEIIERVGGASNYRARFLAVRAGDGWRPPRRPPPRAGGVQTATVVGPTGNEIHTEEHARVRVSHRWDRRSPGDDRSSQWVRTAQPNTFGSILLPRTGWETLVGFANGQAHEPMVLGRLYNATTPPPVALPSARVQSALTSRTTPGGGTVNRIATDDSAGGEAMVFDASKDFNERSENDKVTFVKVNDSWDIGSSMATSIGAVFQNQVNGAVTGTIAAFHTVHVGANYSLGAAHEFVGVGGARIVRTGGNNGTTCSFFMRLVGGAEIQVPLEHQTRTVMGASLVVNAGNWVTRAGLTSGISVGGVSVLSVGGAESIKSKSYSCNVKGFLSEKYSSRDVQAGGSVVDRFRALGKFKTDGAAKFEGGNVVISATAKLTIEAGGVTITMTPSGIKIAGKFQGDDSSFQNCDDSKYG